ncbi:MAG: hypothetical protein MJE68_33945, partial [Proteobacteria bacterium]|nr:hypothetical protein [Pseudomonadota bacterium]
MKCSTWALAWDTRIVVIEASYIARAQFTYQFLTMILMSVPLPILYVVSIKLKLLGFGSTLI